MVNEFCHDILSLSGLTANLSRIWLFGYSSFCVTKSNKNVLVIFCNFSSMLIFSPSPLHSMHWCAAI